MELLSILENGLKLLKFGEKEYKQRKYESAFHLYKAGLVEFKEFILLSDDQRKIDDISKLISPFEIRVQYLAKYLIHHTVIKYFSREVEPEPIVSTSAATTCHSPKMVDSRQPSSSATAIPMRQCSADDQFLQYKQEISELAKASSKEKLRLFEKCIKLVLEELELEDKKRRQEREQTYGSLDPTL